MKSKWIALFMAVAIMATPVSFAATPVTQAKTTSTTALMKGNFSSVYWVNANQLIGANEEEKGTAYYLVDITTKSTKKIIGADLEVAEISVSHNGQSVAMANGKGDVSILNLQTGAVEKITTTVDAKVELTWSSDDKALYYLMGEKIDTIVKYNLIEKTTVNILADKVPYKSDLAVSKNGASVAFLVAKAGKTDDAAGFTVDTKGTEPQLYFLNTTVEKAVPVQVTSNTDNKMYGTFLSNGSYVYISSDTEDKTNHSEIRQVSADGKTDVVLFGAMYVTYLSVDEQDQILIKGNQLSTADDGLERVKLVNNKGVSSDLVTLGEEVLEVNAVKGNQIAVLIEKGDKQAIAVVNGTQLVLLTQ